MLIDGKLVDRFMSKVVITSDGCWMWRAYTSRKGYGQFSVGTKIVRAHRFSYQAHKGNIPSGLQLDHICRVRGCVNPDHLEPVTPRENTLRGISPQMARLRQSSKRVCKRGHERTVSNSYINPATGHKACRICLAEKARQYRAQKRG